MDFSTYVTTTQVLVLSSLRSTNWTQLTTLPLRTQLLGQELNWDFIYKTRSQQDYHTYSHRYFMVKFKLVGHINTLNTDSYSLDWAPGHDFKPNVPYESTVNYDLESFTLTINLGASETPENILAVRQLYNKDDNLSDVEIHCGKDLVLRAHRNVLAAHSGTLRAALLNQTRRCGDEEEEEERARVVVVKEEHVKPAILEDIVRWMYLGYIEDAAEKVEDLLKAAQHLQVRKLTHSYY